MSDKEEDSPTIKLARNGYKRGPCVHFNWPNPKRFEENPDSLNEVARIYPCNGSHHE